MDHSATGRPYRLEWAAMVLGLVATVIFGGVVELRSAFLSRRMGDLDCYLRPAWAATVGQSIYDIREDNGWHYNYPPLYALLMIPLADPPPGADRAGHVPYALSVALFYLLNMACLALAIHLLARVIEGQTTDPAWRAQPRFCRRWWALRAWPALVCLPPIAHTAMRGQVNLQILALLAGWIACTVAGRRLLGGSLLALAICIKVIPIYLLVYPAWKRDGKTLLGCAAGLLVGLVVVPLAVLGPGRMASEYERYGAVFFGPLLKLSEDQSRYDELLGMNCTDNTGIKHAIHNWVYPDVRERPTEFLPAEECAHRILGVLMTLAVLWPMRKARDGATVVYEVGALVVLMVFFSPISHAHYFSFAVPLVMSLFWRSWHSRAVLWPGWPLAVTLLLFTAATAVPHWPDLEWHRDLCIPLFGALPLWFYAVYQLWRLPVPIASAPMADAPRQAA